MSSIISTATRARTAEHFEPEAMLDPQVARKLRGHLEQIDYAAFAANREVLAQQLGGVDAAKFQRLAIAAAHARGEWVRAALIMSEGAQAPAQQQIAELALLRTAYDELAAAYEAMRRMVERGYLAYQPQP